MALGTQGGRGGWARVLLLPLWAPGAWRRATICSVSVYQEGFGIGLFRADRPACEEGAAPLRG